MGHVLDVQKVVLRAVLVIAEAVVAQGNVRKNATLVVVEAAT